MTCQNLGVLCLQWSIVMASVIWTLPAADTKPRLVPPEIVEGPNIHEIFEVNRDLKKLPCSATGTPPIVYKWLFNGAEVLPAKDLIKILEGSLHINNPTSDREGYYQCLASNAAGVAISNITFLQAAVFDTLPFRERTWVSSLAVNESDPMKLHCNHITRSVPPARVTWEMSIDGGRNFREVQLDDQVMQAQNGSLVFSFVRRSNSAIYKCNPYNYILGQWFGGSSVNLTIEKQEASVIEKKVKEPPRLLYSSPDVTVLEGQALRIQCLFGAWLEHKVEWTAPSGVTNVSHAWVIPNVTTADAGVYSCRARNVAHLWSPPVNISVQVDAIPSFATPMSNQEVPDSGRDVTFTCQGRGRPSPKVTWYRNGKRTTVDKLEDALDHSISGDGPTSVLVLKNIRTSATITCNISNAHGYRLQSALVTIGDPKSDAEDIPTSSSQNVIITSQMTSADKLPSTKQYKMTTKSYQQYQPNTTLYHRSTTVNKEDILNTNDPPAPHVEEKSSSSTTTTIIIAASVAVAVVVVLVAIVVVVIIRRRRGSFSVPPEQVQRLRVVAQVPNDQIYDSDDSGFDDQKAENERRALQGHQPSS